MKEKIVDGAPDEKKGSANQCFPHEEAESEPLVETAAKLKRNAFGHL